MLNIEQITSRLAQMPDAMLQKYAAMNKNDPYIMALAVSESNRRKQTRQAAQGQQGMQPQPKVVDQDIAQMAAPMPEDQGIARLPAGPMNFADGGIVAFADGGDVARYAPGGVTRADVDRAYQEWMASQPSWFQQNTPLSGQREAAAKARYEQLLAQYQSQPSNVQPGGALISPEVAQSIAPTQTPLGATPSNRELDQSLGLAAAAPKVDTTQRAAAPGAGVGTNTSDLQALYKKLQGPADKELTELRNQRELFSTALQDFAKKEQTAFETEEAKRGDVFKGRQERIAQQEAKLEGMKDQGLGLALLQAGAAMMSTPGGLGVALGKGVDVGTKQYVAGIDKLNAAQDRLMDAKDRLEELRVNREDMTAKERRALASQVNRSVLEGKKLFLDGAEKDLGYRREDAKTLFSGIVTDLASQRSAGATVEAAKIKAQETKDYLETIRGGDLVRQAQKNIMDAVIKANPYADEPTRQRLYDAEWQKALQTNPALAKYSGAAPGGGGAPASFVFNAKTGQIEPAR